MRISANSIENGCFFRGNLCNSLPLLFHTYIPKIDIIESSRTTIRFSSHRQNALYIIH